MNAQATCTECGKEYQTWKAWLRKVKNPTCSRQCNGKARGREWAPHGKSGRSFWTKESETRFSIRMSGDRNPGWKGGVKYQRAKGNYIGAKYVRCPKKYQAMARPDGYVAEHRLVVARLLGRLLTRIEVVHHLDHNPRNNVLSNLELWPDNRTHKLAEHNLPVYGSFCAWFPHLGESV